MSFFGAVRVLVVAGAQLPVPPHDEVPAEIARGPWAAWAHVGAGRRPPGARFGDACRTRVGRAGRLVEITEDGRSVLVCQEA